MNFNNPLEKYVHEVFYQANKENIILKSKKHTSRYLSKIELNSIVNILSNNRELWKEKLFFDFTIILLSALVWSKEVNTKKYSRLRGKCHKRLQNFRVLKSDGYYSKLNNPHKFEEIQKKALQTFPKTKGRDKIIKITYFHLYNFFKDNNILEANKRANEIIYDLFDYQRLLTPYRPKQLFHLGKKYNLLSIKYIRLIKQFYL